jgi:hypothetical protein
MVGGVASSQLIDVCSDTTLGTDRRRKITTCYAVNRAGQITTLIVAVEKRSVRDRPVETGPLVDLGSAQ